MLIYITFQIIYTYFHERTIQHSYSRSLPRDVCSPCSWNISDNPSSWKTHPHNHYAYVSFQSFHFIPKSRRSAPTNSQDDGTQKKIEIWMHGNPILLCFLNKCGCTMSSQHSLIIADTAPITTYIVRFLRTNFYKRVIFFILFGILARRYVLCVDLIMPAWYAPEGWEEFYDRR